MFRTGRSKENNIILAIMGLIAVLLTLTSLYYMFGAAGLPTRFHKSPKLTYEEALPGHWLKTSLAEDEQNLPMQADSTINTEDHNSGGNGDNHHFGENTEVVPELAQEEVSYRHLNRELDSTNVLYIWTDQETLKVVSIMTLNRTNKKPGIAVVPLTTVLDDQGRTIQEIYSDEGREGIRTFLEQRIEAKLHNYVHIDHEALYALSEILGTLNLHNEKVTMAQALEESAAGLRTNDETIVREVAKKAVQPSTWLKLPKLLKVFQDNINSDFSVGEMLQILNFTRQLKVDTTEKSVLAGKTIFSNGRYCKVVDADTWQNCLYDVTR